MVSIMDSYYPIGSVKNYSLTLDFAICNSSAKAGAPRGFEKLGKIAIYFQGAGEHW